MRRQRLLRHLAQVRGLLCRRSKHPAHRHISHLGRVCRPLGFLVGLYREQISLVVGPDGESSPDIPGSASHLLKT